MTSNQYSFLIHLTLRCIDNFDKSHYAVSE